MEGHRGAEGVFLKALRRSAAITAEHNSPGHGRQSARGYGSWYDSVEPSDFSESSRDESAPTKVYKAGFGICGSGQGKWWWEEEEVISGGKTGAGFGWVGARLPENGVTGSSGRDGGLHSGVGNASASHDSSIEDSV